MSQSGVHRPVIFSDKEMGQCRHSFFFSFLFLLYASLYSLFRLDVSRQLLSDSLCPREGGRVWHGLLARLLTLLSINIIHFISWIHSGSL